MFAPIMGIGGSIMAVEYLRAEYPRFAWAVPRQYPDNYSADSYCIDYSSA